MGELYWRQVTSLEDVVQTRALKRYTIHLDTFQKVRSIGYAFRPGFATPHCDVARAKHGPQFPAVSWPYILHHPSFIILDHPSSSIIPSSTARVCNRQQDTIFLLCSSLRRCAGAIGCNYWPVLEPSKRVSTGARRWQGNAYSMARF